MCLRISYRFIEIFLGSVQVVFHNQIRFLASLSSFLPLLSSLYYLLLPSILFLSLIFLVTSDLYYLSIS